VHCSTILVLLAEPDRLPILSCVEDAQHDDVAVGDLVSNLIFCDENAPDLPPPEARKPLAEPRLGGNAFNAVENRPHGTARGGRIYRLQEVVQSAQVCIGRFGPAERHKSAP